MAPAVLGIAPGFPSHATFRRVLSQLQPDELTPCVVHGTEALRESVAGASGAIEGQPLRRACEQAASQGALPMVSAGANAKRLV